MREPPLVSAVVVVVHRAFEVGACLDSLLAQDESSWEAVVVLNGATAEVSADVERRAALDARIRPIVVRGTTASQARNVGLSEARSSLLYFLDDDVEVPEGGIREVAELFAAHPDVAIAGGPNLTPPDDPRFARLTGALLASPLGTGITHSRYECAPPGEAKERNLTLCNLAARRSLFRDGFAFPALFGGEENVLMGQASEGGHRLWYSPKLWVHHRRRRTLSGYLSQIHRYGFGRAIALKGAPRTFHVAYFAPVMFLAYLVLAPFLARVSSWAFAPLALYAALTVVASLRAAIRARLFAAPLLLPPLFLATHLTYAVGLLRGLFRQTPAVARQLASDSSRIL